MGNRKTWQSKYTVNSLKSEITSLKDKVSWLENKLKKKDDEIKNKVAQLEENLDERDDESMS